MSKKQELDITISETGEVSINVIGAKGKSCLGMTKDLEEALGIVTAREKKASFYEDENTGNVQIRNEF